MNASWAARLARILVVLTLVAPAPALAFNYSWVGGATGSWGAAGNWNPVGIPNGSADTALIDGTTSDVTVHLNTMNASVNSVTVTTGDQLAVDDAHGLQFLGNGAIGASVSNNGLFTLNSAGSNTTLDAHDQAVSFSGSGALVLGGHINNILTNGGWGGSFLNQPGHTFRGGGRIETVLTNNSNVVADNGVLRLQGIVENASGTLSASGAGNTLEVYSEVRGGTVAPLNGSITLQGGSLVGSSIANGTLTAAGSGTFRGAVTLSGGGTVDVPNGQGIQFLNSGAATAKLTNNGQVRLLSAGSNTVLDMHDQPVLFTGGGTLLLGGHTNNYITNGGWGGTLTNDSAHTIRGGGRIEVGLTNKNLVIADNATLLLSAPVTQTSTGYLKASGFANILRIQSSVTGGTIVPQDGLAVLSGATLQNVTLTGGTVEIQGGSSAGGVTAVTNTATVKVDNAQSLHLFSFGGKTAKVANSGTLQLDSAGSNTTLDVHDQPAVFTGSGNLVLGGHTNNYITNGGWGGTITNDVGHTIRGGGRIEVGTTNRSLILADNGTLYLYGMLTNEGAGTVRASGTGNVLWLQNQVTGGQVLPQTGSVTLNGADLRDLAIGSGATGISSGSIFRGTITLATGAAVNVPNARSLTFYAGGLTAPIVANSGALTLTSEGSNTSIDVHDQSVMFSGPGSLVLGGHINNIIHNGGWGGTLTNAAGHTIRGGGRFECGVTNLGQILANNQVLQFLGGVNNAGGTMKASGPANVLRLQSQVAGGQLLPQDGTLDLASAVVQDATIGPGTTTVSSAATLKGSMSLLSGGQIHVPNAQQLILDGVTIQNQGVISLESSGSNTHIYVGATNPVLSGTGELLMTGHVNNIIYNGGWGGWLINDTGHTIRGMGRFECRLENKGVLAAQGGALSFYGGITSEEGRIEARDGGTLDFRSDIEARDFFMAPLGATSGDSNRTATLSGDFSFAQTNPALWGVLGLRIVMNGGLAGRRQTVEAGGSDLGAVPAGFTSNFALGRLALSGAGTYVSLADAIDNGHRASREALYVEELVVPPGTTLHLRGIHLYAKRAGVPYLVRGGDGALYGGGLIIGGGAPVFLDMMEE